jgi:hypothetical protein
MIMSDNVLGHTAATGGILATFFGVLPVALSVLASAFAVIWYGLCIYEKFQTLKDKK